MHKKLGTDVVINTRKCVKSCCLDCDTKICQDSENISSDALVRKTVVRSCVRNSKRKQRNREPSRVCVKRLIRDGPFDLCLGGGGKSPQKYRASSSSAKKNCARRRIFGEKN